MQNPRLAGRYAKSLVDLANERGELDQVFADMEYLKELGSKSKEIGMVLRSPVVKPDKKKKIMEAVTKGNISALTAGFIRLLITKGREQIFLEIVNAFFDQYNEIRGIKTVKLTTATEISEELKTQLLDAVRKDYPASKIILEHHIQEDIVGGFIMQYEDKLLDFSSIRDLNDIRKQFLKNFYVPEIR